MKQFPKDFYWGSATSSYQVEGNNFNADWWQWELKFGKAPSGIACQHYELYPQDFDIIKQLNHNAHRLSIEWSRIESKEGEFSQEELAHYINVIRALKERGIEPIVTLHHFTNPIWFSAIGGWENKKAVDFFLRFCDFVVRGLAKDVKIWITINEPTIFVSHAYIIGVWPPQALSLKKAKTVYDNLVDAHVEVYHRINDIYVEQNLSKPLISISQHMQAFLACTPSFRNNLGVALRDKFFNFGFLSRIKRRGTLDFIGLNYYSRKLVEVKGWGLMNFLTDTSDKNAEPVEKNSLGWDIYPQGLYQILKKLKKFNLPIMITENGICTNDDGQRWRFIHSHLESIHKAMEEGVQVTGYLYWSLMDNFEWDKGFDPRFGLIHIDYETGKRIIRESALKFAQICKTGQID